MPRKLVEAVVRLRFVAVVWVELWESHPEIKLQ